MWRWVVVVTNFMVHEQCTFASSIEEFVPEREVKITSGFIGAIGNSKGLVLVVRISAAAR